MTRIPRATTINYSQSRMSRPCSNPSVPRRWSEQRRLLTPEKLSGRSGDSREEDCGCATEWIKKEIRALSPDPNWLARQIAENETAILGEWRSYYHEHDSVNGYSEGHGGNVETCEWCAFLKERIESTKAKLAPTSKKE